MTRAFEDRLAKAWPLCDWGRVPVVVAVSGGADSVALLCGLVSLADSTRSTVVVGHFNHRLRLDSADDAGFVRDLCRSLQVACHVGTAEQDLALAPGGSLEQAARDARYEFLEQVARRVGARYVTTAHTAHDQAETILHRIVRGTGIRGLAGIPTSRQFARDVTIVRPLLEFRRTEILSYLDELDQTFRHDPTNSDARFTRNRIRNGLLPMLRREYNPQVDESLRRLGMLAEEMSDYVELAASEQLARCAEFSTDAISIDLDLLGDAPPLIVRTMLRQIWRRQGWPEREMTFDRWHALSQLVRNGGAITLPANIRAERRAKQLSIRRHLLQ